MNENIVLQATVENPRISLREIENNVGVARSSTRPVLNTIHTVNNPAKGFIKAIVQKGWRFVSGSSNNVIQIRISPKKIVV